MKDISTLVKDIYAVVEGKGGWDETVTEFFSKELVQIAERRFSDKKEERAALSLSQLGSPDRKLWYKVNQPDEGEPLSAETLGTFFYGDILEVLVIALAKAAGHDVRGLQSKVEVFGVPGSGDVVIDGWRVDVKSASSYGFQKFQKNALREDDPFGYISQLSSYLYADRNNPEVMQKNKAAFLVVKKDRFKLCLDVYDFTEELKNKEKEVEHKKSVVSGPIPPKCYEPVPDGKSGNMKLAVGCVYCVTPETLILTSNLEWREAGSLGVGEGVFGFDKDQPSGKGSTRRFRKTNITNYSSAFLPCVRVHTTKGFIDVSTDHRFLSRTPSGVLNKFRSALDLKRGYQIYWFNSPWSVDKTPEKEYLAGFLDGEGCFSNSLTWSQKDGPVIDKVNKTLVELGYTDVNKRYTQKGKSCSTYRLYGGLFNSIRLVGEVRPVRLLPKAIEAMDGLSITTRVSEYAEVIYVEDIGLKEVVVMETGSGTYISNGFLSHNCDYRKKCWPDVRTFRYSDGDRYLTKVVKEPKVMEVK